MQPVLQTDVKWLAPSSSSSSSSVGSEFPFTIKLLHADMSADTEDKDLLEQILLEEAIGPAHVSDALGGGKSDALGGRAEAGAEADVMVGEKVHGFSKDFGAADDAGRSGWGGG